MPTPPSIRAPKLLDASCAKKAWQARSYRRTQNLEARLGFAHWDYGSHQLGWFSINCLLHEISLELFGPHLYSYTSHPLSNDSELNDPSLGAVLP